MQKRKQKKNNKEQLKKHCSSKTSQAVRSIMLSIQASDKSSGDGTKPAPTDLGP